MIKNKLLMSFAGQLLVSLLLLCSGAVNAASDDAVQDVIDRQQITETFHRVFYNVDTFKWDDLGKDLADSIDIDYTRHGETKVKTFSRDELVEFWKSRHQGYDAAQHVVTNLWIELDGKNAVLHSYVRARLMADDPEGEDYWAVEGIYTHKMVKTAQGWKLNYATIVPTYNHGNHHVKYIQRERYKKLKAGTE